MILLYTILLLQASWYWKANRHWRDYSSAPAVRLPTLEVVDGGERTV